LAVIKKAEEKIVKKTLEIIVLSLAKNKPVSGYEIIRFIRQNFNVWLSAGTVYSTLQLLEKEGVLEQVNLQKVKHYKLSAKGKKTLTTMLKVLNTVIRFSNIAPN
jgi:DNA-binding PadR family transcriptional regulator